MKLKQLFASVIIPVYNGEEFLGEAIESIIKQNYQPLEIIIVDDGSTDKTAEVAYKFKDVAKYIYQQNAGASSARNTGIKIAQGDLIAFLDSDDLWTPNILKSYVDFLQNNPQVDIVQGHLQNFRIENDLQTNSINKKFGKPRLPFNIGTFIYRKSVFERIGLFDENLRHSEDVEFLVRIKENNLNRAVLKSVILLYRRHKNSLISQYDETKLKNLHRQSWLKILKNNLDQRRQKNV
ncbi:glycosyltransferase family A protein [Geminocystis sp. NIES-3709]|uniref:glycosyltransferase family 2 protein n=1 Tax=Geminocystis sp. NIES-3709 TaxID=1617448 RepID=UPI0005FC54FF|nr:glycosyltransferase family A protein [Geminocystis sp. NIES-3709]BAQ65149.1 glycosyl transferase [Geminocystis sp. NIES-3709]